MSLAAQQTNGLKSTVGMKMNQSVRTIRKKSKKTTRVSNNNVSNAESDLPLKDAMHLMFRQRKWKNSRKSRNMYGRGLPKKGGAGGKGVWGKLGSEILEEYEDVNDPNYDPEQATDSGIELKAIIPEIGHEEFQKRGEEIVLEYLENGDTSEAEASFREILPSPLNRYWIVELAIDIAMDHKPSHRELTSVLISDLYGNIINDKDIAKAFDIMLSNLEDLKLDTPEVEIYLSNFIARTIADDCLPPRYVDTEKEKFANNRLAIGTLNRVHTLLTMDFGLVHLDNVWGVGGGQRPVRYLIRQMILLLKEYLLSNDCNEAVIALRNLEVPHFHHELVYEAVLMAIESLKTSTQEAICQLLNYFDSACVLTRDDLEKGFLRVFEDMPDISLDVPLAYITLDRFIDMCQQRNFLTENIMKNIPSRGRKRFVSEGDGGKIKN